jgi:hypothetical protein
LRASSGSGRKRGNSSPRGARVRSDRRGRRIRAIAVRSLLRLWPLRSTGVRSVLGSPEPYLRIMSRWPLRN